MLTATAVVACALNLLGRSLPTPVPIRFLEAPPAGVSKNAEAFLVRQPGTIYFITSSEVFRTAQRGYFEPGHAAACKKLASIIVHEEWHVQHGDDEEGAYVAQVTALLRVNAESAVVGGVRRAMASAVKLQRERRVAAANAAQAPAESCGQAAGCQAPAVALAPPPDVLLSESSAFASFRRP